VDRLASTRVFELVPFKRISERGRAAMGYFALTAVFMLQYLGYVPIPTGVMVAACIGYVLYDTFKR
jgi:hypothetical protein